MVINEENYGGMENYFWLNVDKEEYDWAFSNLKVGESQTYLNLNKKGAKRKNQSCFENIKIGDMVVAYETDKTKAITAICKVVKKENKNGKIAVKFRKMIGYKEFLTLHEMKANKELEKCMVVKVHMGTILQLEKNYFCIILEMLKQKNTQLNHITEFDKAVNESLKLSSEERRRKLENNRNTKPEKTVRQISEFKRDPNVVAEVLIRAKGNCGKCREKGPFNRASDGTRYLEVHHIIRLADGGEDTVENAMAVCPNCHRELHYGIIL